MLYFIRKQALFSAVVLIAALSCFLPEKQVMAQVVMKRSSGFVLQNGQDTLTVERFMRKGNMLEGRVLMRKQVPVAYSAAITNTNQLKSLHIQVLKPGSPEGTPAQQEVDLRFVGDSIYSISHKGESVEKEGIKTAAGAMAYHPNLPMISLLEQIVMRARTMGGKEVEVPVFLLSSKGQTITPAIRFPHADSALLTLGNIDVYLKINKAGEILAGKTSNGQVIKRVETIPDAALATQAPDYSAPAGAPYKAEQVRIQTKAGHVLAGTLTIPKNTDKPVPVVVTITGSSPQDRDNNTPFGGSYRIFRQLADELGKRGIAVLRMDDRGVGQSTGDFESATSPERAEDIREGIKFAQNYPAIDKNKVVLVGLSEGALIAPMIAQTNKKLNGIVLLAGPASTGKEILKYQLQNQLAQSKQMSSEQKEKARKQAMEDTKKEAENNPWLRYFLDYDPLKTAKQVKEVPVLILQGTSDKNVPPADAERLAKAFRQAGNQNVTLKMFEDVNHIFLKDPDGNPKKYQNLSSFEVGPEVLQPIVEWVEKRTKSGAK